MDNFNINTFEKSKLEFANFVSTFFKEHKDIISFSLILKTSHFIYNGIEDNIQIYLDVICIEIKENGLIKKYIPNSGFQENNENYIQILNSLLLKNDVVENYDSKNYKNIVSMIKEQSLFNYPNELSHLQNQTRWDFTKKNIDDDIENFIGKKLLSKKFANYLSETLLLCNKYDEEKTKI